MNTDSSTDSLHLLPNNSSGTTSEPAKAEAEFTPTAATYPTNQARHTFDRNGDTSDLSNNTAVGGSGDDDVDSIHTKLSRSSQDNIFTEITNSRRDSSSDSSHKSFKAHSNWREYQASPTNTNYNNSNSTSNNKHRGHQMESDCNGSSNSKEDQEDVRYGRHTFRKQKTESLLYLDGRHLHGVLTRATQRSSSVRSSLSDINNCSSGSCSPRMTSRETTTSRKRWEMNHKNHKHYSGSVDSTGYQTPLQRRELETRQLKAEVCALRKEKEMKETEVTSLMTEMENRLKAMEGEMEEKVSQLEQQLTSSREKGREMDEKNTSLKEELHKMDALYTETKHQLQEKEEMFNHCYLDMYVKGQKAAAFEREEELAILATNKQPKITVRELARKLSRTELELARWQTLKLNEAYTTSDLPEGQAGVTLSFLKDSFYHFVCDPKDSLRHFKAILEIFKYSDSQMSQIRKSVDDSKAFHKLLKKD